MFYTISSAVQRSFQRMVVGSRKLKKVLSQLFSIEDFKQIDKNIFFRVNEKSRSKIVTFLCH